MSLEDQHDPFEPRPLRRCGVCDFRSIRAVEDFRPPAVQLQQLVAPGALKIVAQNRFRIVSQTRRCGNRDQRQAYERNVFSR